MGPLAGVKIVEFTGIGPGPFAGMILADMGADVVRIDRPNSNDSDDYVKGMRADILARGRRSISLDLKNPDDVETALKLVDQADGLIEGYRPGIMEKLGLGPDVCLARNEKLVFGRMTGWGQDGPMALAAGHDINYIALTGALHAIGTTDSGPVPPLNLVGDFGGGGMLLALGVVAALLEAKTSGKGQVVDAAMTDGASMLMSMMYTMHNRGVWNDERQANMLDGAAPFYGCYECSDGKHIALGSIEPQFYALLLHHSGIEEDERAHQHDRSRWPDFKERLISIFATKTRDEWCAIMETTDVCFAPVLSLEEAPNHAHNKARDTFVEKHGFVQPAPAPRFSRTESILTTPGSVPDEHRDEILSDWLGA
ncbi:MAG: CoA transferase [Alphaproteobacteria bacterium]|nr:MAG: CoA transferase [Alphaproteobacteria bacterium]